MSDLNHQRIVDFKIYVPVQDEENLICHTINALKEVFDPSVIEVLDLSSQDSTVDRVPQGIKVTEIDIPRDGAGPIYTALKNEYSRKQKWVLWVDGDEIYPVRSSKLLVSWLSFVQKNRINSWSERLYWRILKEEKGYKYQSNEFLSAGPKIFNSGYQGFRRAWPNEVTVLRRPQERVLPRQKRDFNGAWFWHGVLLNRSSIKESTSREKKRKSKQERYNKMMTWRKIDNWPWEDNYVSEEITDWTVVHMDLNSADKKITRWKGRL